MNRSDFKSRELLFHDSMDNKVLFETENFITDLIISPFVIIIKQKYLNKRSRKMFNPLHKMSRKIPNALLNF